MTTSVNSVAKESDSSRVDRLFGGFLNSIVGSDQNYVGEDGRPWGGSPNQFVIANSDGSYSLAGQPRSNLQLLPVAKGISPLLLALSALGLGWWFFLRKKAKR